MLYTRQARFLYETVKVWSRDKLSVADVEAATGLPTQGERIVPFTFHLPTKLDATRLDMMEPEQKMKPRPTRRHVDLPPTMRTKSAMGDEPSGLIAELKEIVKHNAQSSFSGAEVKYFVEVVVRRERLVSEWLPGMPCRKEK